MSLSIKVPNDWRSQSVQITLVGCGGNGSHMLNHLARIDCTLRALGHPGLKVMAWDPDVVTEFNLGRQAFSRLDLGQPKSAVLVNRINHFYGTKWEFKQSVFNSEKGSWCHLVISCVDNLPARRSVWHWVKRNNSWWMDLGNTENQGQIVLGEGENIRFGHGSKKNRIPHFFDLFPLLKNSRKKDAGPSCSMAEALAKQDLFMNSTLANFAGQMIWRWLREGELTSQGYFVNLKTGRTAPMPIRYV